MVSVEERIYDGIWDKNMKRAFIDAYNFRFIGSCFIRYGFKKHNLLLEADPELLEKL